MGLAMNVINCLFISNDIVNIFTNYLSNINRTISCKELTLYA